MSALNARSERTSVWGHITASKIALRIPRFAIIASLIFTIAVAVCAPRRAEAANVQFVGSVSYVYLGDSAVLAADRVENFDGSGLSGSVAD